MAGATVFLAYFEWMPPSDDNNEQTALAFLGLPVWMLIVAAGGSIALRIGFSLLPLAFGGWGIVSSYERFKNIKSAPDLNGDDLFTISDVPFALFNILTEVGHRYSDTLSETKMGVFLEITTSPYSIFWSITLTLFVYVMMVQGLYMVWTYRHADDGEEAD